MIRSFLCALSLIGLTTLPALADDPLDSLVQIEVLDGGATAQGTHMAALRLTLKPGWKTYWRAPGDAGIPPHFSWRGSRNVAGAAIRWPAPVVFDQNGMRSIGYVDQLVLPIEITPKNAAQPVRLKGEMELGICKDVCIPATLDFDQALDGGTARNPAIVAALAARPYSAAEAGVRAATCHISPTADGLRIEAHVTMPSAGGTEVAIIESGNPKVWASETRTARQGGMLIAASELVHADQRSYALDRSAIRITVLGRSHAVDIVGCSPG